MALSEKDISKKINTVVQGEYLNSLVGDIDGKIFIGNVELSAKNCEKCDVITEPIDSDEVKKTKKQVVAKLAVTALFPPAAVLTTGSVYDDLNSYGTLINLTWRNGKQSQIFVNRSIARKIQNIFF